MHSYKKRNKNEKKINRCEIIFFSIFVYVMNIYWKCLPFSLFGEHFIMPSEYFFHSNFCINIHWWHFSTWWWSSSAFNYHKILWMNKCDFRWKSKAMEMSAYWTKGTMYRTHFNSKRIEIKHFIRLIFCGMLFYTMFVFIKWYHLPVSFIYFYLLF